ncbi:MAG: glutaredoxin [Myxococcota bacterium]
MSWFSSARDIPDQVPAPDRERALVLYKYDSCPYCVRVLRSIRELGLTVELRDTRTDPAAFRSLLDATGRTQVPCLFVDGEPLFESLDIIAWLEAYAKPR